MKKLFFSLICWVLFGGVAYAQCAKVEIVETPDGFQLLRNGEPYYINGAGGTVELAKLKDYGGNSIRTWGISDETDQILEEALEHGLTVTFGIWMGQERQGFDYTNEDAIKGQLAEFRRVVRKYKDHPAILLWGVGNEMDLDYSNFDVWKYLEEICQMIHEEDPNHPTMAVTAGLDVAEVKLINKFTPSLDILGVNTYGNIAYLPEAMRVYGWKKPYVVAEWGPYGWWEVAKTKWGASIEETSSQKARTYEKSFNAILGDKQSCLGSYVFLWGQKQEHTSTWFGLFTEAGEETEVMDILIQGWRKNDPENFAPTIAKFRLNDQRPVDNITVAAGTAMQGSVAIVDKENDPLRYEWQVIPESTDKRTGGDAEKAPKPLRGIFPKSTQNDNEVTFTAPDPGEYRLFLFVHDGKGKVATGNIPFKVIP
ncbi:MAG: glycoside hydrolase family 2 TIM barrel-domain containing protein [Bacteroidota bacterium]